MYKFSMEACPQMKYELVIQKRKDNSCRIISQKDQKLKRKLTFDIPKIKFQNGLEQKPFLFCL